jgi:MtN3 and saliva related transmembrane protein
MQHFTNPICNIHIRLKARSSYLKAFSILADNLILHYHMNITQIVGIAAGILTAISMLPQLIKMVKEKKAEDVSITMLLVLMAGLAMWIAYGILRQDWPIIVTNSFSLLVSITTAILRVKYSGTE